MEYDYFDKLILSKRINKIKNKKVLCEIFNIILKNNTQINYTHNSSGIFLLFNDLNKNTYPEIETRIDEYECNLCKRNNKKYSEIITKLFKQE